MEDYSVEEPKMSDIAAAKKSWSNYPTNKRLFLYNEFYSSNRKSRPICSKLRSTKNGWNCKNMESQKL